MVDYLRWNWRAVLCTAVALIIFLSRACIIGVCLEASHAKGNTRLASVWRFGSSWVRHILGICPRAKIAPDETYTLNHNSDSKNDCIAVTATLLAQPYLEMPKRGPPTTTSIQDFVSQLAEMHSRWRCTLGCVWPTHKEFKRTSTRRTFALKPETSGKPACPVSSSL